MDASCRVAPCEADVLIRGKDCGHAGVGAPPAAAGLFFGQTVEGHSAHCFTWGTEQHLLLTAQRGLHGWLGKQAALTSAVTGSCMSIHTDWIPRRSDPQTWVVFVLFLGAAGDVPKFLVKGQ